MKQKSTLDYARDLDFHLGIAAKCARLIELGPGPIQATDRGKRIGQGARALREMAREIQEVLRP